MMDIVQNYNTYVNVHYWVMHPVARVSINIVYRNLRTQQMSVLVFCALLTLHVSAPIGTDVCCVRRFLYTILYVNVPGHFYGSYSSRNCPHFVDF
jgi:hypothetical protein